MNSNNELSCQISGLGAWGPGFSSWPEFKSLLEAEVDTLPPATVPKPSIIPANERRRAPLCVKAAVEVSLQAVNQAGLNIEEIACVFGSGLGDTEITDYMCRVLTTELKQLSPTKFHNSVHNAAAGYWTISGHCMKPANSIAAYFDTAGLAFLEAVSQCVAENTPVLITLFDTAAHSIYRQIFPCDEHFAAAFVIQPAGSSDKGLAELKLTFSQDKAEGFTCEHPALERLRRTNPAAHALPVLQALMNSENLQSAAQLSLSTSPNSSVLLHIAP